MWQRFSQPAREVLFEAQREAERLRQCDVSSGHLLLGLLAQQDSVANRILAGLITSPQIIHEAASLQIAPLASSRRKDMALTQEAKRVIDAALNECKKLGDEVIGTEHLLLGLLRSEECAARQALTEAGVTYDSVLAAVKMLPNRDALE